MAKQQELDEIKQRILSERVTPELASQATQLVFGDGSAEAEVVFIGEAPGKHEDEQGKPFVGAAGKFLDEMLAMIGVRRQEIYITNIVKYRPPNNRDPLPEEKKAFLPYLQAQLEVIRPRLIVTLGRHSLSCFLPDLQISSSHGRALRITLQLHDRNEQSATNTGKRNGLTVVIMPLFHPAAALYNSSLRQTLIDDFAKIPIVLAQAAQQTRP